MNSHAQQPNDLILPALPIAVRLQTLQATAPGRLAGVWAGGAWVTLAALAAAALFETTRSDATAFACLGAGSLRLFGRMAIGQSRNGRTIVAVGFEPEALRTGVAEFFLECVREEEWRAGVLGFCVGAR